LIEEVWPNFFFVGGSRCGSTSIYNYLREIPTIFMPDWKTPGYFLSKNSISKEEYLYLFKGAEGKKAVGEASGYIRDPNSPRLIHEQIPHSKIIMSLRDPVERTYSHFLQALGGGYYRGTFEEAFSIYLKNNTIDEKYGMMKHVIDGSFYFESVKRWIEIFGEKQVLILIFEEFISDVKIAVKKILEFLEVDEEIPKNINKIYNPYRKPLGKFGKSFVRNETVKGIAKSILPGTSAKTLLYYFSNKC